MLHFLKPEAYAPWLAPYAYAIVILGFTFFLFRVFENWFAAHFDKPLFRHYFVFKKLSNSQLTILKNEFAFYGKLSEKHKKQFQHRVAQFISEKKFVGRSDLIITEQMKVLIAAVGCMLSFGRKNYSYSLIDFILIYPAEFFSTVNKNYHKGEFNPREKALVLSWKDFEQGFAISNDNLNVGIHEFMHAMQLEAKRSRDLDSIRFTKQFQNILKQLTRQEVKDQLDKTEYFRTYAFTNQYEFMAVLAEYFFESPEDFKHIFPKIYSYTKKLLNFNFANY
ncbi:MULTISPECIES: zinc-dependent peptidase [Aequorivita]|uniref:Zinc-dependent peptidase n=1 Tax=Aequorivita iocasae TaxID=2803865 RepID=A0ABX7DU14_9FLAO|nr:MULTISPECIES: zinc-dependent peptidase [Aequorivita]QQX77012.1 zinc-dependent peptidase [Aequorivita iocasae]UCA56491.1 zinc-dependent peptidase [Aequorivita sp. F7]